MEYPIRGDLSAAEAQWVSEGFRPAPASMGFAASVGRMFYRYESGAPHPTFRIEVAEVHCNGGKIAHGGFVATLADSWLAWAVEDVLPEKTRIVTAVLTVDYLRAAHPGSCLEGAIDRVKGGRRLCHASGMIISNGRDIAAARGMFAVVAEA